MEYTKVYNEFQKHLQYLQKNKGQFTLLCLSYMEIADILLTLVQATREVDGFSTLGLSGKFYLTYNHLNYARYLSVNYADILALETDHTSTDAFFYSRRLL